jgi:GTP-binding protein Era
MNTKQEFCGYVAIIGRPNVGKSTLLNHLIGQKISITSKKPQTTRHQILGIKTFDNTQIIYVDTPGLHRQEGRALNRYMNRVAAQVIFDVDVIVFVVEVGKWSADDEAVLQKLKKTEVPIILAVNKIDHLRDKNDLLPELEKLSQKMSFAAVVPVSALKSGNLEALQKTIISLLPENPHLFPEDQITDRSERFCATELIREKLMRFLGQEVPYQLTVMIEKFAWEKKILHIAAVIYVEREPHKQIVIGEKGERLKQIGTQARLELERFFQAKVFLQLWVKVKQGWSDSEQHLREFGYD